jgi:Fe2+ or Zn2+ uptake regulation protein
MSPTADLVDRVFQALRQRGVRATAARRLVVETLESAGGPQSAADLDDRLRPRVPLSSLYRTLAALETAGVLSKYYDPAGVARYEIAEQLTGEHHHHLVCIRCGHAIDIAVNPGLEAEISALIAVTEEALGCAITDHRLELEGTCVECRA